MAGNDEYTPGAEFLGENRANRSPPTVTFVVDPGEDSVDAVADHAYWLSGLVVRDEVAVPTGSIEAHSAAFGLGRTTAAEGSPGAGVLTGGNDVALNFVERRVDRTEPAAEPVADRLEITASNIARAVVDPDRAGLTCAAEIVVESDGPMEVVLDGCDREPAVAAAPTVAPPPANPTAAPVGAAAPGNAAPISTGSSLPATGGGGVATALGVLAMAGLLGGRRARRRRRFVDAE